MLANANVHFSPHPRMIAALAILKSNQAEHICLFSHWENFWEREGSGRRWDRGNKMQVLEKKTVRGSNRLTVCQTAFFSHVTRTYSIWIYSCTYMYKCTNADARTQFNAQHLFNIHCTFTLFTTLPGRVEDICVIQCINLWIEDC